MHQICHPADRRRYNAGKIIFSVSKMSTGILDYTDQLRDYLWEKGTQEHPILKELRVETANLPESVMQICPEQGALMANLIKLISAKKTLEIGTFTGYSALAVALALPEDGQLVACDVSEKWTAIGKKRWEQANQKTLNS